MIQYRKTKEGDWAVFGPVEELRVGAVTVTKKDGTTKEENVARLSRPFAANGRQCAYGYLAPSKGNGGANSRQVCAECGRGGHLVQDLEDGMMKHYNCCDIPP